MSTVARIAAMTGTDERQVEVTVDSLQMLRPRHMVWPAIKTGLVKAAVNAGWPR